MNMKELKLIRVAVVGCGQIADAHLQEIGYVPGAKLVAVCDSQIELADQAARRFGVPEKFADIDQMVDRARPDVVHLTTPPHTHAPLACRLLAAGVHTYVEKPFAADLAEAERILKCAEDNRRLVCVGHDQLFDPVWLRLEEAVANGQLGDVVHVDSIMGYNLDGPYGKLMFGDPGHWVHRLPGGLFQNNISHVLYKISPFLADAEPRIWATTSRRRPSEPPSELRVMVQGERASANALFSSAARPLARCARIYGTKATVEVDLDGRTLRWHRAAGLPGALGKVHVPWLQFREAGSNFARNAWDFLRCRQQYFAGMRMLFGRFYEAVRQSGEPPIAYSEILRVTQWMDEIFRQCPWDFPGDEGSSEADLVMSAGGRN
jgi:predicted dehydrogenase